MVVFRRICSAFPQVILCFHAGGPGSPTAILHQLCWLKIYSDVSIYFVLCWDRFDFVQFPIQGSHDEVYTDGSKMNERVGAAAVINPHFQNGETTCCQLSKRLPDNNNIFATEATAISLALNYYQHMGTVHHDVVVYSDSMSCLQEIMGEDTEDPFIFHIISLLWSLSDKGIGVPFCWVPSHCGIDGNERVDQLAKETLGKCPLYRYETTGQLLHSEVGSNKVGCSCTCQRSLSCETNTGATKEVPAPNQSWRGCNKPTSNWPYQGHQIPYPVPRTTNWLSPLWSNTDHWPYAARVCIVTEMSTSGILLSDMM